MYDPLEETGIIILSPVFSSEAFADARPMAAFQVAYALSVRFRDLSEDKFFLLVEDDDIRDVAVIINFFPAVVDTHGNSVVLGGFGRIALVDPPVGITVNVPVHIWATRALDSSTFVWDVLPTTAAPRSVLSLSKADIAWSDFPIPRHGVFHEDIIGLHYAALATNL